MDTMWNVTLDSPILRAGACLTLVLVSLVSLRAPTPALGQIEPPDVRIPTERADDPVVVRSPGIRLIGRSLEPAVVQSRGIRLVGRSLEPAVVRSREIRLVGRSLEPVVVQSRGIRLVGRSLEPVVVQSPEIRLIGPESPE